MILSPSMIPLSSSSCTASAIMLSLFSKSSLSSLPSLEKRRRIIQDKKSSKDNNTSQSKNHFYLFTILYNIYTYTNLSQQYYQHLYKSLLFIYLFIDKLSAITITKAKNLHSLQLSIPSIYHILYH
jgi:hypothetical protein